MQVRPTEGLKKVVVFCGFICLLVLCYYLLVVVEFLSAVATIVGLMSNGAELIRRQCIGWWSVVQGGLQNKAH